MRILTVTSMILVLNVLGSADALAKSTIDSNVKVTTEMKKIAPGHYQAVRQSTVGKVVYKMKGWFGTTDDRTETIRERGKPVGYRFTLKVLDDRSVHIVDDSTGVDQRVRATVQYGLFSGRLKSVMIPGSEIKKVLQESAAGQLLELVEKLLSLFTGEPKKEGRYGNMLCDVVNNGAQMLCTVQVRQKFTYQ